MHVHVRRRNSSRRTRWRTIDTTGDRASGRLARQTAPISTHTPFASLGGFGDSFCNSVSHRVRTHRNLVDRPLTMGDCKRSHASTQVAVATSASLHKPAGMAIAAPGLRSSTSTLSKQPLHTKRYRLLPPISWMGSLLSHRPVTGS